MAGEDFITSPRGTLVGAHTKGRGKKRSSSVLRRQGGRKKNHKVSATNVTGKAKNPQETKKKKKTNTIQEGGGHELGSLLGHEEGKKLPSQKGEKDTRRGRTIAKKGEIKSTRGKPWTPQNKTRNIRDSFERAAEGETDDAYPKGGGRERAAPKRVRANRPKKTQNEIRKKESTDMKAR